MLKIRKKYYLSAAKVEDLFPPWPSKIPKNDNGSSVVHDRHDAFGSTLRNVGCVANLRWCRGEVVFRVVR